MGTFVLDLQRPPHAQNIQITMTLTLYYHPASPPSRAVLFVLECLGCEYEKKFLDLMAGEHKKPEYLAINPAGQVPCIVDGEYQLAESRAIMMYLVNKYGKDEHDNLYPKCPKAKAGVEAMMFWNMGLFSKMGTCFAPKAFQGVDPSQEKLDALAECVKLLNTMYEGNDFSKITISDILNYEILVQAIDLATKFQFNFGVNWADHSNLIALQEAVKGQAGFKASDECTQGFAKQFCEM